MKKFKGEVALIPLVIVFVTITYLAYGFPIKVHQSRTSIRRDRSILARKAISIGDEETLIGDNAVRDDPPTAVEIGFISPYHLLYPGMFRTSPAPLPQEFPLYSCLQLLRKAIKSALIRDGGPDSSSFHQSNKILRIEQTISHAVDPLCWLQAQKKLNIHRLHASAYFATAEGTLEVAALGSSLIYSGTADEEGYWEVVDNLPPSSNLYGGQRFDARSPIADEWTDFSKGWWMLPAIEIRSVRNEGENNSTYTIAVHVVADDDDGFVQSARHVLDILSILTDDMTHMTPPTTLPPILSRSSMYDSHLDGQEIYEKGVSAALDEFDNPTSNLTKVVLARRMDIAFARHAAENIDALDVLRKWKFGAQPGGHTFYFHPGGPATGEFFGCTPERLFRAKDRRVLSEALAGTRPRGATATADAVLSRQLFDSTKDQAENLITGKFIRECIKDIEAQGYLQTPPSRNGTDSISGHFFVRRLRHLQHICQRYECSVAPNVDVTETTRRLLSELHPTPAVGGFPKEPALEFIRQYERVGFDRGFYAGPVGFVGKESAEIVVAIRSGLLTRAGDRPRLSIYAGAGIVPGSTVQGEWAETAYKLAVLSSVFPQSPITLQSAITPNVAWATAFIEELIRNGVTQFYVCPGSRSTPLVAAIAKAVRSHVGIVHATSMHDERGAGFRAVGYGRGSGRPAVLVTSSGTAVANLYPAIVEAGMDGIPMLVVTADRPYENRNTGANQAIDQVKIFSDSYVRWFRDFLPPSDDCPVSLALADATHGVQMAKTQKGPVHLNIQFRENLAPDGGRIRNDERSSAVTRYDAIKFTDVPGFLSWSLGGTNWKRSYTKEMRLRSSSVSSIGYLMSKSKRGMIVVGNLRRDESEDLLQTIEIISSLAERVGFPIFASALTGALRYNSPCVVPFAEHMLRSPSVQANIKPDFVLQLGSPLVSTELPKLIKNMQHEDIVHHILVHPHHTTERLDPEFTVTHTVDADVGTFVRALATFFDEIPTTQVGSALFPLVGLGLELKKAMPSIVDEAAKQIRKGEPNGVGTTEPELVLALSRLMSHSAIPDMSLFLSNSMPIRDAEAFLYPLGDDDPAFRRLKDTGVNRGASGIDGIIASAAGFADATNRPTALLIGDVAALHDLNSLHALHSRVLGKDRKAHPLTAIVLNNDGGGIFSFLPIANHGSDVAFEEFFGTPTNAFSFREGAHAFGMSYEKILNVESFERYFTVAMMSEKPTLLEAVVASREQNVLIHKEITRRTIELVESLITNDVSADAKDKLIFSIYSSSIGKSLPLPFVENESASKTLVLLHGWMGDKADWDKVAKRIAYGTNDHWRIIAVDLPGHGESPTFYQSKTQTFRNSLRLDDSADDAKIDLGLDSMAEAVYQSLAKGGVKKIDAIAGYSLGGRVALAMKRLSLLTERMDSFRGMLTAETKVILLSTYPGELGLEKEARNSQEIRLQKDDELASRIELLSDKYTYNPNQDSRSLWAQLLSDWYDSPIWGSFTKVREYENVIAKRSVALSQRGRDIAAVLRQCSPPRCRSDDWRGVEASTTLIMAGENDKKYTSITNKWHQVVPDMNMHIFADSGHALLIERPVEVTRCLIDFLATETVSRPPDKKRHLYGQQQSSATERTSDYNSDLSDDYRDDYPTEAVLGSGSLFSASVASLDYEKFVIDFSDDNANQGAGIAGIGWGEKARAKDVIKQRVGFIIQIMSSDGLHVGIGEVSPLDGLHRESIAEVELQLNEIAQRIATVRSDRAFTFDSASILNLDGSLEKCIQNFIAFLDYVGELHCSVRSGLEMALLSIASHVLRTPIHQALMDASPSRFPLGKSDVLLALNGLITRSSTSASYGADQVEIYRRTKGPQYQSWKIKVGHQDVYDDAMATAFGYQTALTGTGKGGSKIRADANRSFNETAGMRFVTILKEVDKNAFNNLEYIEEPLEKQTNSESVWTLSNQISALEKWYNNTGTLYALDESLSDLAIIHGNDVESMVTELKANLAGAHGCAALILKPSLLGLERSLRIARFTRQELGLGAVFTSSFDTGVGLAFAAFLASLSDATVARLEAKNYSHGLGTFSLLAEDCITPSFGSYVNQDGKLNVASLSRAFYGLGLDEVQCLSMDPLPTPQLSTEVSAISVEEDVAFQRAGFEASGEFEASTATSSDGREINVVASLPLQFSAEVACARFTDLPQQPRWSPWISSVAYVDAPSETEWTLRIRGVNFRWRAKSNLLKEPYLGISWESVSGLKNTGAVVFIPTNPDTCLMKVQIAFVMPRILSPLFRGTAVFFEDFLRNKVLKWSLEMFRDVVKGDLALEEGNVELGDALFGSVEGKASAIQATFANPMDKDI